MADIAIARSPLWHLAVPAASTALALHEKPFHGMVALRVDLRDTQAREAVETALHAALPQANRTIVCAGGCPLRLGPPEVLIVTEPGREPSPGTAPSAAPRGP